MYYTLQICTIPYLMRLPCPDSGGHLRCLACCKTMARTVSWMPAPSRTELVIMSLLADAGPLYGLELVRFSGGRIKRGTVYVTLLRLVEKGFVTFETVENADGTRGGPRRRYGLTPLGDRVRVHASRIWTELELASSI
jgi:DNA-binding PadR family transcriptional regulator